jgi:hypothetical protein
MPRKLRAPKQRYDAKAELDAWEMLLESGHDPRSLATRRRNVPGEARRARVALGA